MGLEDFNCPNYGKHRRTNYEPEEIGKLYRTGLTTYEISDKLNISQSHVSRLLNKTDIEMRHGVNRIDELELNDNKLFAYIIGVLKGDGSVFSSDYNDGDGSISTSRIVALNCADKEFADEYCKHAREFGFNVDRRVVEKQKDTHRDQYYMRSHHKEFYEYWQDITNSELEEVIFSSYSSMLSFVKGIYESEGSIWESPNLVLEISNTNRWIIDTVGQCLYKNSIDSFREKTPYKKDSGKMMYKLFISNKTGIDRFMTKVSPCFKIKPRQESEKI